MRLGDFYFDLNGAKVGDRVQTPGVIYGPKVYLVWKGKRYFVLHVPANAQYWGNTRHQIPSSYYLMRGMKRRWKRPGIVYEWECRKVKETDAGRRSLQVRREMIAEAERLDQEIK